MQRATVDLNTGLVSVVYDRGGKVQASKLWDAVKMGGFTPVEVEADGSVYKGPKP